MFQYCKKKRRNALSQFKHIMSFAHDTLFPHIYTDGVYWYNTNTNEKIDLIDDFRLGAIYEIAKLKKELEKKEH